MKMWARSIQPKYRPVRQGKVVYFGWTSFFSKLFRLDRTDPLSFGPKFPEILVERNAPLVEFHLVQTLRVTSLLRRGKFFWIDICAVQIYNQQLMNEAEYLMKNYGDRVGCTASTDNSLRDPHNFSYDTKAEFNNCFIIHSK